MVRYLQVGIFRFYNEDVAIHSRESGGESTMALLIAAAVLAGCLLASWAILGRPVRRMVEDVRIEHARALFPPESRAAGGPVRLRASTDQTRAKASSGRPPTGTTMFSGRETGRRIIFWL